VKYAYILFSLLFVSCSTLPNPNSVDSSETDASAIAVLRKSAEVHGDAWKNYKRVDVSFDGEWSRLATRIQPILTDPAFRKSSAETYLTGSKIVSQTHTGPDGRKTVERRTAAISVSYNGTRTQNMDKLDAAALVADAYTVFLFGSSWIATHGANLQILPSKSIGNVSCHLVSGTVRPGFGNSPEDRFIAWIAEDSSHLLRFQFTLNGLETTQGADVDVTFSEMRKAMDGSIWPTRFIERVRRPVNIKAHEWRTTSLTLDGQRAW